jgi:calcium permeable stress-gated cation channel
VFTTSYPVTITQSSTTLISYSPTVVTSLATISLAASSFPSPQSALRVAPVCIGHGFDAWSSGLIATIVLSFGVGLLLWVSVHS